MNWRERCAAARERGSFTAIDKLDASRWATCKVGEEHARLPHVVVYKDYFGNLLPVDDNLQALGSTMGFMGAVLSNNFDKAEDSLDAIEDRVMELKRGAKS